uniref:Uncharacterized protein n=1 Tax=Anguilla anguilla TaxID=7936 RepID=A0A0E9P695_ANGAN
MSLRGTELSRYKFSF